MKKFLTFLTLLTLFFTTAWAGSVTLDMKNGKLGTSNFSPQSGSANSPTATNGDITVAFGGNNTINTGTGKAYIGWNNNTTLTVTHAANNITKVVLNYNSQGTRGNITASTGSLIHEATVMTWTVGSTATKTVTITRNTSGNQIQLTSIEVTFEDGGSQTPTHGITYDEVTGGTISGPDNATEGSTVTLTATPYDGYEFTSWTVLDGNADEVTVTNNEFTMPNSDVEVSATFTKTWNAIATSVIPANCGGDIWVYSGTDFNGVKKAQIGDVIYFRVVTDQNNSIGFQSLTITDANGNTVACEDDENYPDWGWEDNRYGKKYKFTMPATAVTITAQYSVSRGTLRLAGRFNGNTGWRTTGTDEPAFTYDSSSDTYTIDAYFTGEGAGNYFYLTYDGEAKHPTADGNWSVQNTTGQATGLTWSGNANFAIENGVFTIELPGNLSTIAFTKKNPTITFNPAAGAVESGTEVSAESNLTDFISSIKAGDAGAQGEVSVKLCTDNSSFNLDNVAITELTTVYGKAWISNIATPVSEATYTIKTIETVTPTYEESFSENFGQFSTDNATVWTIDTKYDCAKGTGYHGGATNAEGWLISPCINLANCDNPQVSFSHAGNYFTNQANMKEDVAVLIKKYGDSDWTSLNDVVTFPTSQNFTFVENTTSLVDYAGEIIQIAFKYTSTTERAGTWEIKNFKVEDAELTYTVTCVGDPSNAVNTFTTDKEEYEAGETVTITVSPKNGYDLTSLSYTPEGGTATTIALTEGQTEYTFQMPAANVTVNASFTPKSNTITVNSDHGTHNCPTSGTTSSSISFTVVPEDGYVISSVTANPTTVAVTVSGNDISFIMPAVPVTLTINYTQQSSGTAIDLFHETFGNNSGSARNWSDDYSVKSGVAEVYSGITGYDVTNVKQGKNTTGYIDSGLNQSSTNGDAIIIIGPLNVANYENLVLTYQWNAASIKQTYYTNLYYATSGEGPYTEVVGTGDGATSFVERSYNLPTDAEVSTLYLKIVYKTSNTQAIIDEVNLAGVQKSVEPEPESITLAGLVALGAEADGNKYCISDENGLLGVYKSGNTVWFKDEVEKTINLTNETLTIIGGSVNLDVPGDEQNYWIENIRTKDFDQSNWIEVDFSNVETPEAVTGVTGQEPNVYIKNLTGTYSYNGGKRKLVLTKTPATAEVTAITNPNDAYVPNPYIPANFYGTQQGYFFSKPKVQEYAKVVDAKWNGTKMVMGDNNAGFKGSFTIEPVEGLTVGNYYTFHGIINRSIDGGESYSAPRLQAEGDYDMITTDLAGQQGSAVTAISTVGVNGEVKSVKYVSVAGVVSDRPFQGVNIVVTEYTDGSRTTAKVVK